MSRVEKYREKVRQLQTLYKNDSEKELAYGLLSSSELAEISKSLTERERVELKSSEEYNLIVSLIDKYDLYDL